MAEWRTVAKKLALADGHISEKETQLIRQAILEDGVVTKSELDFLHELKKEAKSTVKIFDELIKECEEKAK